MAAKKNNIEVIGGVQLASLLKDMPKEFALETLRDINRVGALVYKNKIKENAPLGSDRILNSIKIERDRQDKTALLIGPGRKAYWARFIEFGTRVRKSRGKITPKPFVAPAIESSTPEAKRLIFEKMGKRTLSFLKRRVTKINKMTKKR